MTPVSVEVRHIDRCPHTEAAIALVHAAASDLGIDVTVTTRLVATEGEAERLGFVGSPTFIIDGTDPFPTPDAGVGLACRVYVAHGRLAGTPSAQQIREVLIATAAS